MIFKENLCVAFYTFLSTITIISNQQVDTYIKLIQQEPVSKIRNYFNLKEVGRKSPVLLTILNKPAVLDPSTYRLYKDQYVDYCYLLRDHNKNVFETFKKQYPYFKNELESSPDIQKLFGTSSKNLINFFKAFLLLHDIGKPLGPLKDQHENTEPIMCAYLKKWQFTAPQIELARILLQDSIVSDIAVHGLSIKNAQKIILKNANALNITPKTLCLLNHLLWASDAGSYKSLATQITQDKTGKYIPVRNQTRFELIKTWCNEYSPV